jgi:hypothetical protein
MRNAKVFGKALFVYKNYKNFRGTANTGLTLYLYAGYYEFLGADYIG